MGERRPLPSFGQVDLDLGLDLDFGEDEGATPPLRPFEENVPPSTSRVFETKPGIHEQSTRVFDGDALAVLTRPPPPLDDESDTQAWISVDEAPSESGVAVGGDRVAAMRELYAKGDAEGALSLADDIRSTLQPGALGDHPDASIMVELGAEVSIDLSDPFGGLIPLDAGDGGVSAMVTAPPSAAPQLSLTQRHSIPSLRKEAGDLSRLPIDHRAGFLLAHVDGMQTLEEILDVCAMPATEALELLEKLRNLGVIEFE